MSRKEYVRSAMALALAEQLPKSLREAVYATEGFKKSFQLTSDAVVSLEKEGITFQRSILFQAIRNAFTGTAKSVLDMTGNAWEIEVIRQGSAASVAIARGERRFLVTHLALLSPDKGTRLPAFRRRAVELGLPEDEMHRWEALLEERAPDDEEIGDIEEDLHQAPIFVGDSLRRALAGPTIHLDMLVPNASRYFERLVGRMDATLPLANYVQDVLTPIMQGFIERNHESGYQIALLATSHPTIAFALSQIEIEDALLVKVFEWASAKGDAMARTACLEVGLRRVAVHPLLDAPIATLIDCFVKNAVVANVDQYKLLSSMFVAVYGEMSMRRMFASKPPFWRRLAALAHASLIARQIISNGRDASDILTWLMTSRAEEFVLQCSVDLRLEPRWLADLATPEQFRNELIGRAWAAANSNQAVVTERGWAEALLDEGGLSLRSQIRLERAFLPGPLEGGLLSQLVMPQELLASLQADLGATNIDPTAFFRTMNALLIYKPERQLGDLMAAAISHGDYRIPTAPEASLDAVLFAAASVSAIARHHELADAIVVAIRRYRRLYPIELSVRDAFRVGMVASASREDLIEWTRCVGSLLNDLAFDRVVTREDVKFLLDSTAYLCHLVPELWSTCGQAEAALQALFNSYAQ